MKGFRHTKQTAILLFLLVMSMVAMTGRNRDVVVHVTRESIPTSSPPAPPAEFATYTIVTLNATNVTLVKASSVVEINASVEPSIIFTHLFTLYNPGESIELSVALPFYDELSFYAGGGDPFVVTKNGTIIPHEYAMNSSGYSTPSSEYPLPWWFQHVRCTFVFPANTTVVLEFQMNPVSFYVEYSYFSHHFVYAPLWFGNGSYEINVTIYHAVPDWVCPLNNQTSSNAYQTGQIPSGEYHYWHWNDGVDFDTVLLGFGHMPEGDCIPDNPPPTPMLEILVGLAFLCTMTASIFWVMLNRSRPARPRPAPSTSLPARASPPRYCMWCGTRLSWEQGMQFCPSCGRGIY